MRNIFLGIVSACVLAPSIASAALTLRIDDGSADGTPTIDLRPGESGFIEVFAEETAPVETEVLLAYSVGLNLPAGSGVTFDPTPRTGAAVSRTQRHTFIFDPTNNASYTDTGSSASAIRLLIDADAPEDVANGDGFLRVPIQISGTAVPGQYALTFQLTGGGATELSDDIGGAIPFTPVNAMVNVIPEPAALGLLGFAGLLALRRRRLA
jgi:hypothetical protein